MKHLLLLAAVALSALPARADILDQAKKAATEQGTKAAKSTTNKAVIDKVNKKLLDEGHKNQCAFKTDSDQLEPGCNQKLKNLTQALIDAKKALAAGGVSGFKFVVSGHTDSRGDAKHNKELSQKRADVIVKELVSRGVAAGDIEAVGMGSERPLVKPDNTPAKQARNRRYEIQVKI